jgi:hypothetical protein
MTEQAATPTNPSEQLSDEELDLVVGGIIIYDTVGTPVARSGRTGSHRCIPAGAAGIGLG